MTTRFLRTATLVALAAFSTLALADDDTPGRVGRISLAQGQVSISGETGDEASEALVNWPVTSRNQVTTGRDARTEIRIGSTAVRLDADSALDVAELDDDSIRLHLHYGSASIMVRNQDVLRGFELSTPQGIVRMQEAGRMRVDAGRREDTTVVSVFDGVARVDGGGSRLVVRGGKRAEITPDDIRTGLAMRDSFDEWAMLRDLRDERSESVRYVTSEMTGYEDLDQHGAWSNDSEYGPLWSPRRVSHDWAPYRDGRWTYLHPWGWTWVDNAPWGYAPFHYGRWVMVNQRWCWAPGRNISRVVWSPALVGWVGGSNWNVGFHSRGTHRAAPGQGWYPLTPRDTYVPNYRIKQDNLRWVNRHNGEARNDIRGRSRRDSHQQRLGLTVVPHEHFNQRGTVVVPNVPRAVVNTALLQAAPPLVPPVPQFVRRDRNNDGRPDNRGEQRRSERVGDGRFERGPSQAPAPVAGVPAFAGQRPATVISAPSAPAAQPQFPRRDGRFGNDQQPVARQQPNQMPPAAGGFQPAPAVQPQPAGIPQMQPRRDERDSGRFERMEFERERANRADRPGDMERERRPRGAESYQQQQMRVQQPQMQMQMQAPQIQPPVHQPRPQAQPQGIAMPVQRAAPPPPAPVAQPAPPPQAVQRQGGQEESRRRAREDIQDRR